MPSNTHFNNENCLQNKNVQAYTRISCLNIHQLFSLCPQLFLTPSQPKRLKNASNNVPRISNTKKVKWPTADRKKDRKKGCKYIPNSSAAILPISYMSSTTLKFIASQVDAPTWIWTILAPIYKTQLHWAKTVVFYLADSQVTRSSFTLLLFQFLHYHVTKLHHISSSAAWNQQCKQCNKASAHFQTSPTDLQTKAQEMACTSTNSIKLNEMHWFDCNDFFLYIFLPYTKFPTFSYIYTKLALSTSKA